MHQPLQQLGRIAAVSTNFSIIWLGTNKNPKFQRHQEHFRVDLGVSASGSSNVGHIFNVFITSGKSWHRILFCHGGVIFSSVFSCLYIIIVSPTLQILRQTHGQLQWYCCCCCFWCWSGGEPADNPLFVVVWCVGKWARAKGAHSQLTTQWRSRWTPAGKKSPQELHQPTREKPMQEQGHRPGNTLGRANIIWKRICCEKTYGKEKRTPGRRRNTVTRWNHEQPELYNTEARIDAKRDRNARKIKEESIHRMNEWVALQAVLEQDCSC